MGRRELPDPVEGMMNTENTEKNYYCWICVEAFTNPQTLDTHVQKCMKRKPRKRSGGGQGWRFPGSAGRPYSPGQSHEASVIVLGNLTKKALEGQLADQQISRILVATDLKQSDGTRVVAVRLLHTTGGGADLRAALVASCLRGALPPVDLRAVCLVRAILSSCTCGARNRNWTKIS
eukprot:g21966.t1